MVLLYIADTEKKLEEKRAEDGQPLVARWSKPNNKEEDSDSEEDEVVYSYAAH